MQRVFSATGTSGDVYLEPQRGFWSIVRPVNQDIINYIANPSFESHERFFWHGDAYTHNSTVTVVARSAADQDVAWDGNYALRINQSIPGSPYGINYAPDVWGEPDGQIPVPAGKNMYIMAHVRAAPGDRIQLSSDIDGVGFGGTVSYYVPRVIPRTTELVANGDWQRIKVMITNQREEQQNIQIFIRIVPGPASTGFAWVDAVSATRYDISDYFDGDSPGATWFATPFLSYSTMSRFSRFVGEEIFLNDIGFNITSYQGHGMTPMTNDTIQYGQGGGAYYNRSWPDTRTISITGQFESRYGIKDVHKQQSKLVELVGLHRFYVDPQPFMLRYRLSKSDVETTGILEIPVVYKSGLEGVVNNLYQEKVTLQLEAFEELFWRTWGTKTVALTPNVPTTVCYKGTAPASMRLFVEGQTVGGLNIDLYLIINQTLGAGIYWNQSPSLQFESVLAGESMIFGDLDRICGKTYQRNNANGTLIDVSNHVVRPYSVPSEFVLVHGNNDLLISFADYEGIVPAPYITYRERYLSATDIWRIPRTGERGVTYDPLKFLEACR